MRNWILLLFSILALQACVDQEFDEPPFGEILVDAPEVTGTIADLKALHVLGVYAKIEQDITIRAVVSANDQSGNLYKRIVIQDDSGAIELNINDVDLHNSFQEGREIYVKCQGLWMGDFNGLIGIGGSLGTTDNDEPRLNAIEPVLLDQFVIKGTTGNEISPVTKTINQLTTSDISKLVEIENLEFQTDQLGNIYSESEMSTNLNLEDCNGTEIVIRTSNFANFANITIPDGNGKITAIYTVFGNTKQLLIRRPEEVVLNGPRCDGSSGGGGGVEPTELPEANTTIAELKASHNFGTYTGISSNLILKGIITADDASGNFFKKIMVQDASAGIELLINEVDLADDYGLEIGREIAVNLNGLLLGDFEGNISIGGSTFTNNSDNEQLGGIDPSDIATTVLIGENGKTVTPITKTIAELGESDIHSLVTIEDIQFTDDAAGLTLADVVNNFSQNLDLEDCDGNEIIIRTSSFASYAGASSPSGKGSITAIYSVFGGAKQLFIRELNDLALSGERCDGSSGGGGDGGGTGSEIFNIDFQGLQSDQVIDIAGWTNFAEVGSLANSWYVNDFDGNSYGEVSAFQSSDSENVSWLISPAIGVSSTATISFMLAQHHWDHAGISVLISDNFNGDPSAANWQTVNCNLPTENDDWYAFVPSGDISISDYFASGSVNVAFRYEGSSSGNDTSFLIDDIIATD